MCNDAGRRVCKGVRRDGCDVASGGAARLSSTSPHSTLLPARPVDGRG